MESFIVFIGLGFVVTSFFDPGKCFSSLNLILLTMIAYARAFTSSLVPVSLIAHTTGSLLIRIGWAY